MNYRNVCRKIRNGTPTTDAAEVEAAIAEVRAAAKQVARATGDAMRANLPVTEIFWTEQGKVRAGTTFPIPATVTMPLRGIRL